MDGASREEGAADPAVRAGSGKARTCGPGGAASPACGTASAPRPVCPGCAAAWCAGHAPARRRGCRTRRPAASLAQGQRLSAPNSSRRPVWDFTQRTVGCPASNGRSRLERAQLQRADREAPIVDPRVTMPNQVHLDVTAVAKTRHAASSQDLTWHATVGSTACPACWLLDVSRLIASRMVFCSGRRARAQRLAHDKREQPPQRGVRVPATRHAVSSVERSRANHHMSGRSPAPGRIVVWNSGLSVREEYVFKTLHLRLSVFNYPGGAADLKSFSTRPHTEAREGERAEGKSAWCPRCPALPAAAALWLIGK